MSRTARMDLPIVEAFYSHLMDRVQKGQLKKRTARTYLSAVRCFVAETSKEAGALEMEAEKQAFEVAQSRSGQMCPSVTNNLCSMTGVEVARILLRVLSEKRSFGSFQAYVSNVGQFFEWLHSIGLSRLNFRLDIIDRVTFTIYDLRPTLKILAQE